MHRFILLAFLVAAGCSEDLGGGFTPRPCDPGDLECLADGAIRVCNEQGSAWIESRCAAEQACVTGGCADPEECPDVCKDVICEPGETFCGDNYIFIYNCNATGTNGCFDQSCASPPLDGVCFEGACVSVCGAGQKSYLGCEYFAADLDNADVLCSGACSSPPCPMDADGRCVVDRSVTRCWCDAASQQYSVVISNPNPASTAHVIISDGELEFAEDPDPNLCLPFGQPDPPSHFIVADIIPPKGIKVFNLPKKEINGTVLGKLAYRIASNIPISVYQFNPLENVAVFTNDASMLIPTTATDKEYFIMTRPQFSDELRGFMTVIGVDHDPTLVTITTSASIYAGKVLGDLTTAADDTILPAIPKGATRTFLLERFDVLNLEPDQYGADLTGTFVSADKPVVVFGGHEAANVPTPMAPCASVDIGICLDNKTRACTSDADCASTCQPVGTGVCANDASHSCGTDRDCPNAVCDIYGMCSDGSGRTCSGDFACPIICIPTGVCSDSTNRVCARPLDCLGEIPCCADHLEQQLFPISTWGRDYLAVRSYQRRSERDVWRLLAAEDGTTVTLDPAVANVPPLNRGEWFELEAVGDFVITANKPIMVGQFLAGQGSRGAGTGDPAFILAVPVRQFRTSYIFLAPGNPEQGTGYAENYVSIATKQGTEDLTLLDGKPVDGASVDAWTNVMPGGFVDVAAIADSGWVAYRIPIEHGVHSLSCPETCSVMVHGYDQYVSYGYPGGLNLLECKEDADCKYPRRLCDVDFTCVECLTDNDCVAVGKSVCGESKECVF